MTWNLATDVKFVDFHGEVAILGDFRFMNIWNS